MGRHEEPGHEDIDPLETMKRGQRGQLRTLAGMGDRPSATEPKRRLTGRILTTQAAIDEAEQARAEQERRERRGR